MIVKMKFVKKLANLTEIRTLQTLGSASDPGLIFYLSDPKYVFYKQKIDF